MNIPCWPLGQHGFTCLLSLSAPWHNIRPLSDYFCCCSFLLFCFWDNVLLCDQWPGYSRCSLRLAFWVLGLQAWATTPDSRSSLWPVSTRMELLFYVGMWLASRTTAQPFPRVVLALSVCVLVALAPYLLLLLSVFSFGHFHRYAIVSHGSDWHLLVTSIECHWFMCVDALTSHAFSLSSAVWS